MTSLDWKGVFKRVKAKSKADNITLLAAGVALYGLLAMVPGLVALISGYGLFADPDDVEEQVVDALSAAPEEVRSVITQQLTSIVESEASQARLGVILGLALALWAASSGIAHLIEALNVAYDEEETRGWAQRKALALILTIGTVVFLIVAFASIALVPALLADSGLGDVGRWAAGGVRWVILLGGMLVGLAVLYRYGPDRKHADWRWISPGAVLAAVVWLLASIAVLHLHGELRQVQRDVRLARCHRRRHALAGDQRRRRSHRRRAERGARTRDRNFGPRDATGRTAGSDSTGASADPAVDVDHESVGA